MRRRGSSLAVCVVAVATAALVPGVVEANAKKKTFSSGTVHRAIPQPMGILQPMLQTNFRVKPRGKIKDLNVAVRISAPDARDLTLAVVTPSLKLIRLKEHGFLNEPAGPDFGSGPPTCSGTPTVFDTQAPTPILQGAPPFLGSYAPDGSLKGANRGRVDGKWALWVLDEFAGTIGGPSSGATVLNCWKVTVRYKPQRKK